MRNKISFLYSLMIILGNVQLDTTKTHPKHLFADGYSHDVAMISL